MSIQVFIPVIQHVAARSQPNARLHQRTAYRMVDYLDALLDKMAHFSTTMMEQERVRTISDRAIQNSVRLVFPEGIARSIVVYATGKITMYVSHEMPMRRRLERVGIITAPRQLRDIFSERVMEYKDGVRFSETSIIYLATVFDYMISYMIDCTLGVEPHRTVDQVIHENHELRQTFCSMAVAEEDENEALPICVSHAVRGQFSRRFLTLVEARDLARRNGIPVSGDKEQLCHRLVESGLATNDPRLIARKRA